ncbi:TPA: LOW QUALITY PROTEIN: hypothetical protein N0F65_003114 [Lagenidium giganteum]|uniref:SCP domain-containing protein n=1 Tax=Lagenidium giganteum TaxID=4803 RepID=A0AAV2YXJ9_9STRA|nr:TPA: LOW QUALITY PROTEIN: hypothetical protein N0F65_003114 [Lagenidium giganteum]
MKYVNDEQLHHSAKMPGCSGALTIAVAVMAAALIFEANTSLRMLQKGGEVSDQVPVRDAESGPRRAWKGRSSIILQLPATAQGHSDDVAANDYSDHTGSDGSKMTQRIKKAGFEGNGYAENVAAGQASVQTRDGVVDKVTENNILGNYKLFGVGYARNEKPQDKHYWTQNFGDSGKETGSGKCEPKNL